MIVNPGLRRNNPRGSYLSLPGTSGNYASTPDAAQLDIVGDISIICYLAMTDWTPAAESVMVAKSFGGTNNRSYLLAILAGSAGTLQFRTSAAGTTTVDASATVNPSVADGNPLWIGVQRDVDNGAAGNTTKFYTSPDGVTWTQLGADVTNAGATTVFNSSAELSVGATNAGTASLLAGRVFRAQVYSGLYFTGAATLVADFNPRATTRGHTSFTDSTGKVWTVNGTAAIL